MTAPMTSREALWSRDNLMALMTAVSKSNLDLTEQALFGKIADAMAEHLGPAQSPAWQPIETAPKDRNSLLDYDGHVVIGGFDVHKREWTDGDNYIPAKDIRGWMPIPSVPSTLRGCTHPHCSCLPSARCPT